MWVQLDYTNLTADAVGDARHGITAEELDAIAPAVAAGHEALMRMRQKGALGFYDLPDDTATADRIAGAAQDLRGKFTDVVVLGIGGSALGARAAANALLHPFHNLDADARKGGPRFFVMDNVDPETPAALFDILDAKSTLFIVITKSGSTAETMALFGIVASRLRDALGQGYTDHLIAITDAEKGDLRKLAREHKFLTFDIPANVGGRFSVLSAVGLVPSAILGVDIHAMLEGARTMRRRIGGDRIEENVSYMYAATQFVLATKKDKSISVMMPYSDRLSQVADWYGQLWAESLGKKLNRAGKVVHVGPTPVSALGATDQHSQIQLYMEGPFDKVITFLAVDKRAGDLACEVPFRDVGALDYFNGHTIGELLDAERRGTEVAVTAAARPNATILVKEICEASLGALFFMFEAATALSGELYDINAFDQPGVEAGKTAAYALMGRRRYEDRLREIETVIRGRPRMIVG